VFHKHSFSSIPLCANPLIVFLLLTVLLLTWKATLSVSSGIIRKDVESLSDYSSIIPLALGTKWAIDRPFWSMRMISSIPIFLSFAITTYWWDRITSFYKGRLPWANLWKPAYAQRAITLDYQNCRFPFFLALKNRHWMLATLLFGSFILVPSPILAAYVYNFKWVLQSAEPVAATKSSTWRASLNSPETPLVFRSILQHTFIRWGNTSAVPKWSSHRESLIPIEWESSAIGASYLPEGYVGYWRVETESLRAELQCTNLTHVSRDDTMVLTAELFGDYTTANGSEEIDLDPCSGVATDTDHRDDSICSRWQLMDLKSTTVSLEPVWIISAANYTKGTSGPTGVLLCIPKIFVGKGTAELLSNGSLNDAAIHRYTPISEAELDEGSAARDFSRLLNHSVFTPDTDSQNNPWYDRPLGLMFSSPLITTPQFRGDILSFLQYKDVYRNRLPLFDYEIFASTASEVFSALVSTAADSTLLFRTAIVNETIPIRPLKWRQVPSPVAAKISVAYTLFVAIVMAAHIIIILTSKKYRFPIAPEPLENSLFLLYRSTIPSLLETKIPHPELQSLSTFHSRVHQLQLRYMLGRGKDNASFSSLRVDVASPVLAEYVEESDDNNDREPIMRAYRRSWRSGVQAGKNFVSAWKRGWRRGSRVQVRDIFQHRAVRWVTWPLKAVIEAGDFVGGLSARFPRRRRASWDSDYRDDYDHHELERLLDEE
jgi:hypothetical protein